MSRLFGLAMGAAYFLFLGLLGSYVVGGLFSASLSGISLMSIGLALMLVSVPVLMFTRLSIACVFLALVGLMFDNAGIAQSGFGGGGAKFWYITVMAQVIFLGVYGLTAVKEASALWRERIRRSERVG